MSSPAEDPWVARGRRLTLDFECLQSIPEGINEVRVWWSDLLNCEQVGKRVDLSLLEEETLPEAATLVAIDHRNVVPVRTAAEVSGYPPPMRVIEIVTPYYPRGSVTDALLRGETFTCSQAVGIAQATLRGLACLHQVHSILHRDMKSGNVLLTGDGSQARVADLGLAAKMGDDATAQSAMNPTLYTPPEWITEGRVRRQSDLYPVGLMLRELVAGPFPYEEYTTTHVTDRLARMQSPLRGKDLVLPPWTPRGLRRVITKAEQRDWRSRYATAAEMDSALSRATVAEWRQVGPLRWEAPRLHYAEQKVAVEGRTMRGGQLRLSSLQYRTQWRRIEPDVDVASVDSVDAHRVFDNLTAVAARR
ncbi:protein kinase [uncultured Jatrophihabitans sp.]|uniref:protein kinase domain-containing protein n=1 Tax=uncultured Jatrophihabitans sp. TaxID=1610747 RepID=UPI0035CBACA6